MNRETKLKNCPFCGGSVIATKGMTHAPFYFFKCQNVACHAIVSFDNLAANMKPSVAVDNWNGRTGTGELKMKLIDEEITVEQVRKLLDACYEEFCQVVGEGVCGCDICPYRESDAGTEEDCYEAYIKDKLNEQSGMEHGIENAIEVEPVKHGEWIDALQHCGMFMCTGCEYQSTALYRYCPHCGAKMDGGRQK